MNVLLRLAAWLFAIVLVALPIVAVLNGWIGGERWPMRKLALTGQFHLVEDARVREAVLPLVGRGFFAVDLDAVRDAVSALAWVESVQVRKRWPDRLEISLREHRPVARWGEHNMLAASGQRFAAPAGQLPELPLFEGPAERALDLMAFHQQAQPQFAALGLQIERVVLSARGSWSLGLSDGLLIDIGRGEPEQRLGRFLRLLPALRHNEVRQLQRADLRYTNGFALTWQEPLPLPASPTPEVQVNS